LNNRAFNKIVLKSKDKNNMKIVIIGGGAAGFFAAITCAELDPTAEIVILERGKSVLGKVKISGGGRCNVTNACFINRELIKNYPRGAKELMSPFSRFSTGDTMAWFDKRGVELKIEDDDRVFPVSDNSQTIVDCLWNTAKKLNVAVQTNCRVENLMPPSSNKTTWTVEIGQQPTIHADKILLATGSNPKIWAILEQLGHNIVPPVPSLFTFNIKDPRIEGLAGVSVPLANVKVLGTKLQSNGALLVTHWGLSAPAILKLSAYGARVLHDLQYQFSIQVNWLGSDSLEVIKKELELFKEENPRKQPSANALFDVPNRLWKSLVKAAEIQEGQQWANVNKKQINNLTTQLVAATFQVQGKSTFKEEFVTAGGIDLKEVEFKTFESKLFPNLFFAGEILNIDAITGGFNFQAAWTGGWVAGNALAAPLRSV
jgi:predicted Rossmann fold flavoprotein